MERCSDASLLNAFSVLLIRDLGFFIKVTGRFEVALGRFFSFFLVQLTPPARLFIFLFYVAEVTKHREGDVEDGNASRINIENKFTKGGKK